MTSCRRVPLLMRWMMYSRTFSSRSVWLELPKNILLRIGSRVGSSPMGTKTLLFSVSRVWWLLCSGGSGSLLQPENAQERSVLTGGHERRTASDAQGAECLLSPIVRQQPSDHGPEAVSKEEERGQEASVHRPSTGVVCFLTGHGEVASVDRKLVSVGPLAHLGPIRLRKGAGDFGPGRTPE